MERPSARFTDDDVEQCAARGWANQYSSPVWVNLPEGTKVAAMLDARRIIDGDASTRPVSFVVGVLRKAVRLLTTRAQEPATPVAYDDLAPEHKAKLEDICQLWGVTVKQARGLGRERPMPQARADCWRYLRSVELSYPQIGRIWGRDHSTIISGVKTRESRLPLSDKAA